MSEQREKEHQERERPVREREAAPAETVTTKIAVYGQTPISVSVAAGSSVASALKTAKVDRKSLNLRVNGRIVSDDYKIQDMDVVTLLPQIRGGA